MPDAPTPLDLDAIEAAIAACRTYNFGMYQADRLAHEHAPALVEEVKRLRAEVARLTARPAPAWDEEVVKPSRETVIDALWGTSKNLPIPHIDREEMVTAQADVVLSLLPGRSEAEVKAEALREAARFFRDTLHDHGAAGVLDRLAAEGGADRG